MKKIKMFLASSVNEFKDERNAIGAYIGKLNNKLLEYDIKVKLFECEFFDNNISAIGRKQEEYNEEIRNSDIFIMLIGEKAGIYTVEEFNVAQKVENLQRYILFKKCESNETVNNLKQEIIEGTEVCEYTKQSELINIIRNIIAKNILLLSFGTIESATS